MAEYELRIPDGIFDGERLDERLPGYIGQIVMLGALLEHQVAAIASSVQDLPQEHYFAQDFTKNVGICERRLKYFPDTPFTTPQIKNVRLFLAAVTKIAVERNEVVHRVWARTTGDLWGGHKGSRSRKPQQRASETKRGWEYEPARFQALIDEMVALIERGREAISNASSLPRLPTPFADGV